MLGSQAAGDMLYHASNIPHNTMCKVLMARSVERAASNIEERRAADLEEALAQGRILVSEQAARHVGIRHFQEMEVWLQPQANALLRQQRPAHTETLRYDCRLCNNIQETLSSSTQSRSNGPRRMHTTDFHRMLGSGLNALAKAFLHSCM